MAITISQFKSTLEPKLHGSTLDQVSDFYGLLYEAAGNVLRKIDPFETRRITALENALYDKVYDYQAPTGLKGNKIIDIKPQVNRGEGDSMNNTYSKSFDKYKNTGDFTIQYDDLIKTIRISESLTEGVTLSSANSLTDNGTWSAGGNASGLVADTYNYVSGSASLKFDITASGSTAYIENSTLTSVDLSDWENVCSLFVYVYIPSTTIITSITLYWGSSASDYYYKNVTTTHDTTSFVTGWNLLRFDWSSATTVGSPDSSAIDYVKVLFNYNGTATTSCRVDNIVARLGTIYNIEYYSKYLFKNSSGTWIERPTTDEDYIILDIEGVNLLLYETGELISQQIQGEDARFDLEFFMHKKKQAWDEYMASYKSESLKSRQSYYRTTKFTRR